MYVSCHHHNQQQYYYLVHTLGVVQDDDDLEISSSSLWTSTSSLFVITFKSKDKKEIFLLHKHNPVAAAAIEAKIPYLGWMIF